MDKVELIKIILGLDAETKQKSFLTIGKVYSVRTVTMIYVGRLKDFSSTELLFEKCAWIPETARWADYCKSGDHKEAEPYTNDVIINRGSVLDITEFPVLIEKQK